MGRRSRSMSISTLPLGYPSSCKLCRLPPASVAICAIRLTLPWKVDGGCMNRHVLEVSTHVFRVLQRLAPLYISYSEEKAGRPTQHIVIDDDVYSEIIDRAIAKRKTIDEVFLEIGRRVRTAHRASRCIKRWRR